MKRSLALLLTLVMSLGLLAGCGTAAETPDTEAPATEAPAAEEPAAEPTAKKIDTLKVAFVPSREPEEIITVTEPLKQMLKDELAKLGYEVGDVEITVGTTYEAVGEGLEAGTIDVGLIPGGGIVERGIPFEFNQQDKLTLNMRVGDFSTAQQIAERLNAAMGGPYARAVDSMSVSMDVPPQYRNNLVPLMASVVPMPSS